jgi:serine protease
MNTTRFGINTGTSMAAPHVTGAVALYLERNPTMTPNEIREALMNDALNGRLMTIYQLFSANKLLHIAPQA